MRYTIKVKNNDKVLICGSDYKECILNRFNSYKKLSYRDIYKKFGKLTGKLTISMYKKRSKKDFTVTCYDLDQMIVDEKIEFTPTRYTGEYKYVPLGDVPKDYVLFSEDIVYINKYTYRKSDKFLPKTYDFIIEEIKIWQNIEYMIK